MNAHQHATRLHRLGTPMILAVVMLLALGWVLAFSAEGTALAASFGSNNATNSAPLAADDAYTTTGYAPLNILAPGVLGNDSDPDGDPLIAILDNGPSNGNLTINSDGSFTYQAVPGFVGTDTFTYIAADGDAPAQAYWPFEEGSGTTTADAIGNGYDGTLMNGPSFTTTVPVTPTFTNNYALQFDGIDDYVDVPIDVSETAYAVTLWLNTSCDNCGIYSVDDGELGSNGIDRHLYLNSGDVCARVWSNEVICSSGVDAADGNWHHLAHIFGGDVGGQQIYIDGQLVISGTKSFSDFNWQTGINIGFSNDAALDYLDGMIDDVRIYMFPLAQVQVAEAMTSDQLALGDRATVQITVPTGVLAGEVTDGSNGSPIAGTTISAAYDPATLFITQSDDTGMYDMVVPAETFTVTAEAFGYAAAQFTGVSVPPGVTTTLDIPMNRLPYYLVEGLVTDANTGWPLYASIDIDGYPGDPIWSDPETGYYSISLPEGITYTFNVEAWVAGYLGESRDVGPLTGDTTEDFALDVNAGICNAPGYEPDAPVLLFSESFDAGIPVTWSVVNNGGDCVWRDDDPGGHGNLTGGAGLFAIADSDFCGNGSSMDTELWTPTFDTSGYGGLLIEYKNDYHDLGSIAQVDITDDGFTTWTTIDDMSGVDYRGPETRSFGTNAGGGSATTQARWHYIAGWDWWWEVDDVNIYGTNCKPPAGGGLVVGNVYDENTQEAINDSTVENEAGFSAQALATPLDQALDDAFYTVFSPSGSQTFTATTSSKGYGPDIDTFNVVMSNTVRHDFHLPAGLLSSDPNNYHITLDMGLSTTVPLNLSNTGGVGMNYEIFEKNDGFSPVFFVGQSSFVDMSQVGPDTSLSEDEDGGNSIISGPETGIRGPILAPTTPNAWVVIPSMPVGASRPAGAVVDDKFYVIGGESSGSNRYGDVQIYDPDTGLWDNTAPKMPVGVSNICAAVIDTNIYIPGGYNGYGGITDLQVFHTDSLTWETITSDPLPSANFASACAAYEDRLYVFGGNANAHWVYDPYAPAGSRWDTTLAAAPVASSYGSALAVDDLIFYSGLGVYGNFADVYAYDPSLDTWITYPSLNTGRGAAGMWAIGDMLYVGGGGWSSYLTSVEAYDTSLGTGGTWSYTNPLLQGRRTFAYASSPASGHLFVGAGWAGAYLSEAEQTEFPPIPIDVPWLFENPISGTIGTNADILIDLTFDAGVPEVNQPGDYHATLQVRSDTPYPTYRIPVTMTVNTPSAWGKVGGTLTLLGYCDADPTTPKNQEILIEGSSGFTATTKTDENGYYQWWIDPSESPLTVTVAPTDYETGVASGVTIITGETTTADFDLRLLKPCVSTDPTSFEKVLFLGDTLTETLDLHNGGAISTTFDITETSVITWLSEAPLTGILDSDEGVAKIDITFDSSGMASTGTYNGQLRVDTDDPVNGTILIPVDMVVVSGTTGVSLDPDSTLVGHPGTSVTHTFTVTNSGEVTDIYDLSLSGNVWVTSDPPVNTSFMDPGETFTFTIAVDIPNNLALQSAVIGSDSFSVMATSQLDGSSATATGTTLAEVTAGVELSADQNSSGLVGTTIDYTLQVTNTGSHTDTFTLAVSGNAWVVSLSANSLTLGAGASSDLVISVSVPAGAAYGDFDLATVSATSSNDPAVTDQAILTSTVFKYRLFLPVIYKP